MKPEIGPCVLLLVMGVAGCDDGAVGTREQACRTFCEKLESCDDRTDLDGCIRGCGLEKTRSDAYLAARTICVRESSCNVWTGEVGAMGEDVCLGDDCNLNDCTSDTLASQTPSGDEIAYCGRVVSKLNACDHALTPAALESNCLQLVPSLSRSYLEQVQNCIEVDCGQVRPCLDRVGDLFNTNISMYPPNDGRKPRNKPI